MTFLTCQVPSFSYSAGKYFLIFPGRQIFPLVFPAGGYFLIRLPNKEISARREDKSGKVKMMENYLRHCISYLACGKSFCLGFFFFSCLSWLFRQFRLFFINYFDTCINSMYISSRAKRGTKYTSKMSRIYACVEKFAEKSQMSKKSRQALEKKKSRPKTFPPSK